MKVRLTLLQLTLAGTGLCLASGAHAADLGAAPEQARTQMMVAQADEPEGEVSVSEEASDMGKERSRFGIETANQAREQAREEGREFGQEVRERAHERRQEASQARESARDRSGR